ncbi:MAG: hypothetical protein ABID38_02505 [Candidatus Diapherotrites archaeon]
MKKTLVFGILLCILVNVSALTVTGLITMEESKMLDEAFSGEELKQEFVDQVNANLDEVPDFVIGIFETERINITLTMNDGKKRKFGAVTKKGKLLTLYNSFLPRPTMNVSVRESTIDKIKGSSDSVGELVNALNSGMIEYEGLGMGGKIKEVGVKAGGVVYGITDSILGLFGNPFGWGK